ncbi:LysR family transcriptional regulator [Longispora sp. NPDC051575]|uniref:LysR family transcriptional regulator n=1 Tax=Longispora sp. NPDC051575 TaxID=3154943 RepID=UPI0034399B22
MELEIRHLRVVCAIADAGAVSRAAAALGVSQPALAAQLRRIEDQLGGPLYTRGRSGVVPTELGEFVLAQARDILGRVRDLQAASVSLARGGPRPSRVGGSPGVFFTSMLDHLQEADSARPVESRTEPTVARLLELLGSRALDGIMLHEFPGSPPTLGDHVLHRAVADSPEFVILPAGHPLAGEREVRLSDLATDHWVLPPSSGDGQRGYLRATCERAGFLPRVTHETADPESAVALIRRGQAIGIASATFQPRPGVVVRPLEGNPLRCRYLLAWWADRPLARHVAGLTDRARRDYAATALSRPCFADWLKLHDIDRDRIVDPWGQLAEPLRP